MIVFFIGILHIGISTRTCIRKHTYTHPDAHPVQIFLTELTLACGLLKSCLRRAERRSRSVQLTLKIQDIRSWRKMKLRENEKKQRESLSDPRPDVAGACLRLKANQVETEGERSMFVEDYDDNRNFRLR
jgi:hypothetical protein